MSKSNKVICSACGVVIEDNLAYYSYGKPSDLEFLAKRVCQYRKVDKPCSNTLFDSTKDYEPGYEDVLLDFKLQ